MKLDDNFFNFSFFFHATPSLRLSRRVAKQRFVVISSLRIMENVASRNGSGKH